ncbi:hypothetical protein SAMN02949497_3528 [Methylomagnum ishizawai]|uniref:Uncharacterized protein n=1 Tax=Methylomagnum ishizawai TaxID=1760988 RepID=A0A1Y6D5K5_9GAMM|nr:hypothetical protein [Methylomagnum ishizawai]SMF96143.1 hypothetical protein SAMN02949497_3528 [Methylomagnum ishizawai]
MKIPPINLWTVNQAWLLALALAIAPMKGAALRVGLRGKPEVEWPHEPT